MTSQGLRARPIPTYFRPIPDLILLCSKRDFTGFFFGPRPIPTYFRPIPDLFWLCSNHDFAGSFLGPRPISDPFPTYQFLLCFNNVPDLFRFVLTMTSQGLS